MSLTRFLILAPKGTPSRQRCCRLLAVMLIGMFGGLIYGCSEGALLSPILASSAGMLPSAILCARFLLIPYG